MTQAFYKQAPRQPWEDWRTYSMLLPIVSSAIGAALFMALGFAFAEIEAIPSHWRTPQVLAAAYTVAFGAAFGTIGSGIEIFRKVYTGQARVWDWVSLSISGLTTVGGFVMGFAALMGATSEWSRLTLVYGCIVVGTLAALDSLGDMIELGGLFGSFEQRYEQWEREYAEWREAHGITLPVDRSQWREAALSDIRRISAGMNGERYGVTVDNLQDVLDAERLRLPELADTTRRRWVAELRDGGQ